RIDECLPRDPRVFIAPEPGATGEIEEEIRAGRVPLHIVDAPAVIAPVVVDERPAIAEAVRLERVVNVCRAVGGIGRAGVLHGVVDALAGVLDVENLVTKCAQPEQVHQRTPGYAAEWIAGDDAREQNPHRTVRRSPFD